MISTSKLLMVSSLLLLIVSGVSATHTFDDEPAQTGFSIPEFESNQEILTQLVAPFIFVFVFMQYTLSHALHFALDKRGKVKTDKETTLLSLAIVTMLVPSPFWQYIQWAIQGLGTLGVGAFVALFVFVVYLVLWRGG